MEKRSPKKSFRDFFIYAFTSTMFFERSIWMVYLLSLGLSSGKFGLLQSILSASMFFSEVPSGYLADHFSKKHTLVWGHMLIVIYSIIMAFFNSYIFLAIGFLFYGIGLSLISGSDQGLLYQASDGNETIYHKILSTYSSINIVALLIASTVGGLLQKINWKWVFIATAIMQLISIFVVFLFHEEKEIKKNNGNTETLIQQIKLFIKRNKSIKYYQFLYFKVFSLYFICLVS